ncbi:hypothetical protein YSY43_13380 [Paenibacillus sp. YSY-4.3]
MDRLIQANALGEKGILLSEHKQGKDLLFPNSLDVEVVNVSCVETASFINHLPEGAPIPDIGAEQAQISVIYVYFPIGDGEAYLTTKEWAEKMICYAPYNWDVEQAYDPDRYGVYFKLYPLNDYDLVPREKMYFSIGNLVSFGGMEKMVYVAVRFTNIPMSGGATWPSRTDGLEGDLDGTDFLAYFKKRSPLKILDFECSRTKVAVGDMVKLEWAVAGDAVKCVLTPGDIRVDRVGSLEVEVFTDTTFRLYALGANEQISRTAAVYVERPVISRFTSNCPDHKTLFGHPVILSYEAKDAYGIYLNQGIGRVSGGSITVVPGDASTEYILSCMGPDRLVQERMTITVTDFLKVQNLSYTGIRQKDGSYKYYLKWNVANCKTIHLTTSDGQLRSSGQASGDIQFSDTSPIALTVTLHCTGTSGQIIDHVFTV